MDSNSWIEQIQSQLNFLEFFYQNRVNRKIYQAFNGDYFKKLSYDASFLINRLFVFKSSFMISHFGKFGFSFPSFFNIQPWFVFWLRNSIDLVEGINMRDFTKEICFLGKKILFENRTNSGFLIGSKSLLILYATVLSELFLLNDLVFENKKHSRSIYYFLRKLKTHKKSFRASFLGENDPRTFYCAFILASLYNILTPEFSFGINKLFTLYQNHEGGGSIDRQREGHGAITFCYMATMVFCLKKSMVKNLDFQTKNWILEKQTFLDFGFHGKTSKLSDSCYSFWIGAISIIANLPLCKETKIFLFSFQENFSSGLVDKIGKTPDLYHTCYFLSGLSLFIFFNTSENLFKKKNSSILKDLNPESFFSKINPIFGIREKVLLKNIYKSSKENFSVCRKRKKIN